MHIEIKILHNIYTLKDDLHNIWKICILNYQNLSYSSSCKYFKEQESKMKNQIPGKY